MLRDLHNWFFSEWFRHVFEIVASVLSLAVAGYTTVHLRHLTRRNASASEEFSKEVSPWMDEARRTYAKEKLVPQQRKRKEPSERAVPSERPVRS